jgi:hypothetical protein
VVLTSQQIKTQPSCRPLGDLGERDGAGEGNWEGTGGERGEGRYRPALVGRHMQDVGQLNSDGGSRQARRLCIICVQATVRQTLVATLLPAVMAE